MATFDIGLDQDFDLNSINGDFSIEDTSEQHVQLVLATAPGHWRQSPLLGAKMINFLNSPTSINLAGHIKSQLELDGMSVNAIDVSPLGEIEIDGDY